MLRQSALARIGRMARSPRLRTKLLPRRSMARGGLGERRVLLDGEGLAEGLRRVEHGLGVIRCQSLAHKGFAESHKRMRRSTRTIEELRRLCQAKTQASRPVRKKRARDAPTSIEAGAEEEESTRAPRDAQAR